MDLGSLGKAKVIAELTAQDYNVFVELDGKSPFDLVTYKENRLERIEIKSTRTRNRSDTGWEIQIKKVRPNKIRNKITNFNSDQCDILAVYIEPLDKVMLYNSKNIKTKSVLVITDKFMSITNKEMET